MRGHNSWGCLLLFGVFIGWVVKRKFGRHQHRANHEESEGNIADSVIPFPLVDLKENV